MLKLFSSLFMVLAAAFLAAPAADARRGEQADARLQMQAGKVMSLRAIESMVVPRMGGMQYLGPEYDPESQVYRLKFIDRARVVFVDVDATNGQVVGRR